MRLAVVALLASCSSVFPSVPQWKPGDPPLDCEEHPVSAAVDGTIAIATGGVSVALLSASLFTSCRGCDGAGFGLLYGSALALPALGYGGSAYSQVVDNRRCREGHEQQAAIARGAPPAFCTASNDGRVASCTATIPECQRARDAFGEARTMSRCEAQLVVQCFELGASRHCAPTTETCDAMRTLVSEHGSATPGPCTSATL